MSVFKTFIGITLLITSMGGEATGRVGKQATSFVGKISYQTSEKINNHWQNDFAKYATGALETTKSFAKNGQKLFESLEEKSKKLGDYANNLLRDEEYRSLKQDDFDSKFGRGDRGVGGGRDWTLINPSSPEIQTEIKNDIQEASSTDIRRDFKPLSGEKPLPALPKEENKLKALGNKVKAKYQQVTKSKEIQEKPVNKNGFLFNTLFNRLRF